MTSFIRFLLLLGTLLFSISFGYSQSAEKEDLVSEKNSRFEIGFNATTVLSSFIGNESLIEPSDFPLLLRVGFKKFLFKMGFGINGSSRQFSDSVTGSRRVNDIREYYAKAGLEFEFFKENKWVAYSGIDAIYNTNEDKVTTLGFNEIIIKNSVVRYGGGPVLGLKYYLNKRLYLSTEATLYGFISFTDLTQEENGIKVTLTEKTDYLGSIQSPLFLYVNYRL